MAKKPAQKFVMGRPRLVRKQEWETALIYAGLIASTSLVLAVLYASGAAEESGSRLMLSFALGLILACALASSLAFIIVWRHRLLLIALASFATAAGSIFLGITPLESLAKIVLAASTGLWISLMLSSTGQVVLIASLIIAVDFYSVFFGPTKKLLESGGPWLDYFTISLPVFGESAVSRLGISDIIFFSLFLGCTLVFSLRRLTSALAMTASFVVTMIIGVELDIGVPALPLLSIFFLSANADVFIKRLRHSKEA